MKKQLSHSKMQTARCMYCFKKQYIDKDIDFTSDAMRVGGLLHDIVHDYCKELVKQKLESDYETMVKVTEELFNKSELADEYYQDVMEVCLSFGERALDYDHMLDFEKWFDITYDDVQVVGKLDRVDAKFHQGEGLLEIIDYKSQRNIDSTEKLQDDMQMKLYRWAAVKHLYEGYTYVRRGIYYLRWNFIKWIDPDPVYVGDLKNEFYSIEENLKRQWKRIFEKPDYTPERGRQCWEHGGCAVMMADKCPLWDMAEVKRMRDTKERDDKVRVLRKVAKEMEIMTAHLKEIVPEEGIEVDGEFVGYQMKGYYQYPLSQTLEFICSYSGMIDYNKLTLTGSVVDKMIEKYEKVKGSLPEEEIHALEDMRIDKMRKTFVY